MRLKYFNDDFVPRTLFFVGDFSEVEGGQFTNRQVFISGKSYLQIDSGKFVNESYAGNLIAFEDGVERQFLSIAMEADLTSPETNTSKKEFYIEGEVNTNYLTLTREPYTEVNDALGFTLGVNPKDAFISELIFYDRYLPMEERQKVEGYVACKWNLRDKLPSYHPYSPNATPDLGCPFKN